jgi:hypothetical protein
MNIQTGENANLEAAKASMAKRLVLDAQQLA